MSITKFTIAVAAATLAVLASVGLGAQPTSDSVSAIVLTSADAANLPRADSPSPTLGSTPQPGVNLPGDNDGDAADYSQLPLVLVTALTLVVVVGGSITVYLIRRGRRRHVNTEK
jgi:hypothetical protein